MRVRVGDETHCGPAVDLSDAPVEGDTAAAAVRGDTQSGVSTAVSVACLQPSPVHERAGYVRPGMGLRVRTALAAAARSRGLTAPQDERRRAVYERLGALDPPSDPDLAAARRRVAGTTDEVERLRERVATLRGRLSAAREAGRDAGEIEAELNATARDLAEAETERAAAREAVERARRRARKARDRRERRRRLEEKLANLARDARAHLAAFLREEFAAALALVPGRGDTGTPDRPTGTGSARRATGAEVADRSDPRASDPFDADPVPAALAVCRVARLRAPVVLDCGRFADPGSAADWLDARVVRV